MYSFFGFNCVAVALRTALQLSVFLRVCRCSDGSQVLVDALTVEVESREKPDLRTCVAEAGHGVLELCVCCGQKVPQMATIKAIMNAPGQSILWYPRNETST